MRNNYPGKQPLHCKAQRKSKGVVM